MEFAKPSAPAIRLAGRCTPGTGLASDRHRSARVDLDRVPMTARTAGARNDELDRSPNTKAPRTAGFALDDGLPTGTAMSSTTES